MIKFPYESTVLNKKSITQSNKIGFSNKEDKDPWYETKILFDLADVIAFDQTYFKDIEPPMECVEIESRYRYSFTIKDNYKNFKNQMIKAGLLKN